MAGTAAGITGTVIAQFTGHPGAAKNPAAFATRYNTNSVVLVAWDSGNLARKGEALSLVNPGGTNLLTFTYSNAWYPTTYNTGLSLVAVDLSAAEPLWSTAANWRPSLSATGSPGQPDTPRFSAVSLASGTALTLSTEGLDGTLEVWYSDDLVTWTLCPGTAWARSGSTLTVDLQAVALPTAERRFFQLRVRD